VGFGIVSEEKVAQEMFEQMPHLEKGAIGQIHLFPLEKADQLPDLVVVEDEVEKLMWIVLSYMHARGGARVQTSTAVLQATCVDTTVIPLSGEEAELQLRLLRLPRCHRHGLWRGGAGIPGILSTGYNPASRISE